MAKSNVWHLSVSICSTQNGIMKKILPSITSEIFKNRIRAEKKKEE
jgi:hypothetical protein